MEFRSIPPDPRELPRAKLLWPPAVPAAIALSAWLAEQLGHQWNIHGDAAAMLMLFALSVLVGAVVSLIALASVLPALRRYPSLRSRPNLVCSGIAVSFVVAALVCIAYVVFRLTTS